MSILALDLGTKTGWAIALSDSTGDIICGEWHNKPTRYEGGGMRYLRFRNWLDTVRELASGGLSLVVFEEVRRHIGVDAAHVYGGFMSHLTAWCEGNGIPYQGVPVATIKQHATGKGNANKQAVIDAMRARGHVHLTNDSDNEADAIALVYLAREQHHHETTRAAGVRPAPNSKPRRRVQVGPVPVARKRVHR